MIKFHELIQEKYKFLQDGVPLLEVGEYEVKSFHIFDDTKFMRFVYFDTTTGFYKTGKPNLVRSIVGGFGRILQEQFDKGETVLIEIVNQSSTSSRYGLAIRTI